MLQKLLEKLCDEFSIAPIPLLNKEKFYPLSFSDTIQVKLFNLDPGVAMSSEIVPPPLQKREDLFIFLMRANLLGQGTGGCRIGLDKDEKVLTLSLGLPYEMNYQIFKERFEDFINYLVYWREMIVKMEQEMKTVL